LIFGAGVGVFTLVIRRWGGYPDGVAFAVLLETSLSFLGLGVQPPAASWGNMLSGARGYLRTVPGLAFFPGAMIFITVLCYNWFGDGLRDAIDPTLAER